MIPFNYFCDVEKFCQHIEKLLAQHDYVVVPGLGGFVVQMQSAELLTDSITPPLSTIGFNPLMHHADGLLAIEIARSEQISYRKAMEYIESEVENIKSNLDKSGNIPVGNLGTFYQQAPGNLFFSPEVTVGFLPQNFELTHLYFSQRNKLRKDEKPRITLTLPSTRVFKYASVACLIAGLFLVSPKLSDMRQPDSADIASSAFYNFSQKAVIAQAVKDTEKKSESIVQDVEPANYHVIVASLPTQEAAEDFCKELIGSNFHAAHVLPPSKTYRIAIQSFSDKDEAIQFMEHLRKSDTRFTTAWVYCND